MKYFTRYELFENGAVKELKVPQKEVIAQINLLMKRDKEMLKILEKFLICSKNCDSLMIRSI